MDHFIEIYRNQAEKYHRMIGFEDFENNLLQTIQSITSLEKKRILDLGSGTGRLPFLFKNEHADIVALDFSFQMLSEQHIQIRAHQGNWELVQGDIRAVPLQAGWADITTAGWAAGHFCAWYPDCWQENIDTFISEMLRTTRPGGVLIIMETMGTGSTVPAPPTGALAEYYQHIETKWNFSREVIRTDYKFHDLEQAKENTAFFFGEKLAEQIEQENWRVLPEWTGVWHRQK